MKKLLTILALVAFAGSSIAAESRLENYVNKKLSPLTQKEKEINAKIEAQQKADAQRKAEMEAKQKANQAALEKVKKEAQARQDARKNAIEAEKKYWKSLTK